MSLYLRFRKDYLNYLNSIIIPALITALTIPVLKRMLGPGEYGLFANHYNGLLILTAISSGWVSQSIIRFFQTIENKNELAQRSLKYVIVVQLLLYLPVIIWFGFYQHHWVLCALLCATLMASGIQSYHMALAQSGFLSGKTIYSETIRTLTYILGSVVLVKYTSLQPIYALFIAVFFSFVFSVLYLRNKIKVSLEQTNFDNNNQTTSSGDVFRQFLSYGIPLSLWFAFANLLTYFDKIIIRMDFGAEIQGNYQSMFDLLSRGFTMLISPVLISLMPLLSIAYKEQRFVEIRSLLKKILLFQIAGFLLAAICYWWFAASWLMSLLKVPDTEQYRQMGFIILSGTFIWQIAMVVHKYYELRMKSHYLLFMVIVAFSIQVLFFQWIRNTHNPVLYSMGYLCSSSFYLVMVSFKHFINLSGLRMKKQKTT